jgi:hypothetical protein
MEMNMDTITITPKEKRSGMIMPLVATIVVFIFLLGIAMLKIGFSSRFTAARTTTEIAARSAADAGLAMAMHLMTAYLETPSTCNYTFPNTTRTSFFYEVTDVTVAPDPIRRFRIRSTGVSDQISRTVYAMTWATSFWSYAIAVDGDLSFKSKTVIDTWPTTGGEVDIRTNSIEPSAVTLFPNTSIPGDVVVGPGGDADEVVQVKSSSEIDGQVYAADNAIDFPDVSLPAGLPDPPALWPRDPCSVLGPGSYSYYSIDLKTDLEISGHVVMYVAGNMILDNSSELFIAAGSSLTLYLGGSLEAKARSLITNADNDARNLNIYGTPTCYSIRIFNEGDFWGAIYAPSARLEIKNSGATYGAFVGESFEMKNSGEFYYDTRLYDYDPTGRLSFFQVERWWERGDEGI